MFDPEVKPPSDDLITLIRARASGLLMLKKSREA